MFFNIGHDTEELLYSIFTMMGALIVAIYFIYKAITKKKMNNILLILTSAVLSIIICLII